MLAFGGLEMLIFLLAGAGSVPDAISLVDPTQYFAARQIDLAIDKMVDLAAQDPNDAPTQVKQLLALRYLADNAEKLKKAEKYADHRKVLEAVAAGKAAQDAQGFAREYAERVLARLDGKDMPAVAAPKLREDALAWFPSTATLVGAIDSRPARSGPGLSFAPSDVFKKVPENDLKMFYSVIEKLGNVRVDRIAMAYVHDDKQDKAQIYVRLTGKANAAWIMSTIKEFEPQMQLTQRKDGDGNISVMQRANNPPVLVFVGNTEMMLVGHAREAAGQDELVDEFLAIRAGKKPNAARGALRARLQKVPDRAVALLVGDVPPSMGKELNVQLGSIPQKIDAFIEKLPPGFDVSVIATMANENDALATVTKLSMLRKQAIDALQQMLKQPDANPRLPVNALINLVESLQMQSEGSELRLRVLIPRQILQGFPSWFMF
jgi:hypothetical protein